MTSITFIPSNILCGHSQFELLKQKGVLDYRFQFARKLKKQDVEWADVIVFLRSDTEIEAYVSEYAKKVGKHLVYVLDDNILDCPSYLSCYPYYSLKSTKKAIRTIMSNCDVFLTPSPVLLEKYGEPFKYKYLISEPSLNRIKEKRENEKVKIGFAGSIDRTQDINVILEEAITKIHDKYKDSVDIEFMGAKPDFVEKLGLTYLPYQDGYEAYTKYMGECNWDIGLAPMPDSDFHSCKYFNKFVEYASFGIVGIYSNLKPYVFGIKDRENGLLVENTTESWINAISELIDDEKLRKKMSKECIRQANEIYSLEICTEDYYEKCLSGFVEKDEYGPIPDLTLVKIGYFIKLVWQKVKEKKLYFPIWAMQRLLLKLKK